MPVTSLNDVLLPIPRKLRPESPGPVFRSLSASPTARSAAFTPSPWYNTHLTPFPTSPLSPLGHCMLTAPLSPTEQRRPTHLHPPPPRTRRRPPRAILSRPPTQRRHLRPRRPPARQSRRRGRCCAGPTRRVWHSKSYASQAGAGVAGFWSGRVDGSWAGRGCLEGRCWCRCGWCRWAVEEDSFAAVRGRTTAGTDAIKECDYLNQLKYGLYYKDGKGSMALWVRL